MLRFVSLALAFGLSPSSVGAVEPSAEDVAPGIPFQEGEILDLKSIQKIKDFLPPPFWKHRDLIFFEGMQMEIGPFFADYSPNEARQALTEKYRGTAKIGRGEALENYTLGQPFPDIDPEDPQLDIKHAWNAAYKHDAQEGQGSFYFTYWDEGGEQLPLYYEGTGWGMRLAHRTDRADTEGRVFKKEKRMGAGGFHVTAPFDARGILGLGYRYLAWEKAPDEAKDDDIWIWIPDLRRVRRISGARRTDAIAGTDFTPEDRGGFSGLVPDYTWEYLGSRTSSHPSTQSGSATRWRRTATSGRAGCRTPTIDGSSGTPSSSSRHPRTSAIPTPGRRSGMTPRRTSPSSRSPTLDGASSGSCSTRFTGGGRRSPSPTGSSETEPSFRCVTS